MGAALLAATAAGDVAVAGERFAVVDAVYVPTATAERRTRRHRQRRRPAPRGGGDRHDVDARAVGRGGHQARELTEAGGPERAHHRRRRQRVRDTEHDVERAVACDVGVGHGRARPEPLEPRDRVGGRVERAWRGRKAGRAADPKHGEHGLRHLGAHHHDELIAPVAVVVTPRERHGARRRQRQRRHRGPVGDHEPGDRARGPTGRHHLRDAVAVEVRRREPARAQRAARRLDDEGRHDRVSGEGRREPPREHAASPTAGAPDGTRPCRRRRRG